MNKKVVNKQSWENVARTLAKSLILHDYCGQHLTWRLGLEDGCRDCETTYAMQCYFAKSSDQPQPSRV